LRSDGIRNLRAKTVKPVVSIKRASETVEEDNTTATTGTTSTTQANGPVFPVKSVTLLKKTEEASAYLSLDKENIDPLKQVVDWDDLDTEDSGDPLMVSDYVAEIFDYMKQLEKQVAPSSNIMVKQPYLNWHMRSILVDWLIEVQWKLKLLPETLYLSINIVDRILSIRSVSLTRLQLVGLAATLLASKYEEIVAPSVQNFVFLADNSYNATELLTAERYIFQNLNYTLAYPSPMSFLRRISKAESYDIRSRTLAKYLMEIACLDPTFVPVGPSLLAAVGIFTARLMLRSGPWTANLVHYSGYQEIQVRRYSNRLLHFLQQEQRYLAIHRKYSSKKYMKASVFVYDWIKRHFPTAACLKSLYYSNEPYEEQASSTNSQI